MATVQPPGGLKRSRKAEKERGPVAFYVYLTLWSGRPLAVRYVSGREVHMESVLGGGTHLFFPSGLIYVQESPSEVREKIQARLTRAYREP